MSPDVVPLLATGPVPLPWEPSIRHAPPTQAIETTSVLTVENLTSTAAARFVGASGKLLAEYQSWQAQATPARHVPNCLGEPFPSCSSGGGDALGALPTLVGVDHVSLLGSLQVIKSVDILAMSMVSATDVKTRTAEPGATVHSAGVATAAAKTLAATIAISSPRGAETVELVNQCGQRSDSPPCLRRCSWL